MIPGASTIGIEGAPALPWTAQIALLMLGVFIAMKTFEMAMGMVKDARSNGTPVVPTTDQDSRIEVLRKLQGDVLSTYLQGSVLPILTRQTEILEGIRGMSGQHHEALARIGFEINEMRAQQGRTHEGVHRLAATVQDLIANVPKRRNDDVR